MADDTIDVEWRAAARAEYEAALSAYHAALARLRAARAVCDDPRRDRRRAYGAAYRARQREERLAARAAWEAAGCPSGPLPSSPGSISMITRDAIGLWRSTNAFIHRHDDDG